MQQQRNELEQAMPQYQRDALDRARAEIARNQRENPAIVALLDQINGKLDELLSLTRADKRFANNNER